MHVDFVHSMKLKNSVINEIEELCSEPFELPYGPWYVVHIGNDILYRKYYNMNKKSTMLDCFRMNIFNLPFYRHKFATEEEVKLNEFIDILLL